VVYDVEVIDVVKPPAIAKRAAKDENAGPPAAAKPAPAGEAAAPGAGSSLPPGRW
jgi:hypothetical protein